MQITSFLASVYGQTRPAAAPGRSETALSSASQSGATGAADAFLAEAKKTPAQRIREDWLARHKLSEDSLNDLTPEQRDAVEKEIAEELKRKLTGQDARRGASVNLTA